jgi:hypothetical protein
MKVERLHYDLGNVPFVAPELQAIVTGSGADVPVGLGATASSISFNGNIARVGVNYHF